MENQQAIIVPAAIAGADHQEVLKALTKVIYHSSSFAGPMAIKCAVELGIPRCVARLSAASGGSPVTLPDLVAALPLVHPSKAQYLPRILAVLVELGLFTTAPTSTSGELAYLPTPFSSLLEDEPSGRWSMARFFELFLHPAFLAPWHHLGDWFRRGSNEAAAELAHGETMWAFLGKRPELASLFNDAMASISRLEVDLLIHQCGNEVFHGLESLVDVGGGTGATARAIKEAFPGIRCTVLDLPHAVSMGKSSGNVEFVAGDMFEAVPPADAIFLKNVLHDWTDDDCIKILKKCKDAIPIGKGRVVVYDIVMSSDNSNNPTINGAQLFVDLTMMIVHTSKERTKVEWQNIFTCAGFKMFEIKQQIGVASLMVGYP